MEGWIPSWWFPHAFGRESPVFCKHSQYKAQPLSDLAGLFSIQFSQVHQVVQAVVPELGSLYKVLILTNPPGIHFTTIITLMAMEGKSPQEKKKAFSAVEVLIVTRNTKINSYKIKHGYMRLPHWAKLSNKKEKNSIYVVFFSWILLNNINTSEWTEIEREAGTRQGQ